MKLPPLAIVLLIVGVAASYFADSLTVTPQTATLTKTTTTTQRVGGAQTIIQTVTQTVTSTRTITTTTTAGGLPEKVKIGVLLPLSGSERQTPAKRAMINKPKLLILDEPTANLAPKAVAILRQKIKTICEQGVPILMVEQNVRKALQISHYIYVLGSGRCVYEGESQQLLAAKDFGKIFLGVAK